MHSKKTYKKPPKQIYKPHKKIVSCMNFLFSFTNAPEIFETLVSSHLANRIIAFVFHRMSLYVNIVIEPLELFPFKSHIAPVQIDGCTN